MSSEEISLLIESIDNLSARIWWLTAFFVVAYFSICIGLIWHGMNNSESSGEEKGPLSGADDMIEEGKLQELEAICRKRVRQRPYLLEAHWYLALALYHQGNYAEAIESFKQVNAINPFWEENTTVYLESATKQMGNSDSEVNH